MPRFHDEHDICSIHILGRHPSPCARTGPSASDIEQVGVPEYVPWLVNHPSASASSSNQHSLFETEPAPR